MTCWASAAGARIQAAAALAVAVMFLIALPTVFDYVRFLWRERTNALQWRLDFVYFCFVVFWVAVIVRAVIKLDPARRPQLAATGRGRARRRARQRAGLKSSRAG